MQVEQFGRNIFCWELLTSNPSKVLNPSFSRELRSRCLQTMFMPQQHTGENIAEAIQAVLEAWALQETHQVCLTTDSGSNVVNAAERL